MRLTTSTFFELNTMRTNMFLKPALEEAAQSSADLDDIHTLATLQPKPGVGVGEPVESEEKPDGEVGEDHPFAEFDEIDVVAESQETTLALESIAATANRFLGYASALEEIANTVEDAAAAGNPLEPTAASLLTTAIDGAGIGEPLSEAVALESFSFSHAVATESFIEDVKARAGKVLKAVGEFAKKSWDVMAAKLKRFADYFRSMPKIVAKLEKEIELTEGVAGRNFEDAKLEKKSTERFFAPSSVRSVPEIIKGSMAEYDSITSLLDGKYASDLKSLERIVNDGSAEEVIGGMNKMLASIKAVLKQSNDSKYSTFDVINNLPEKFQLGKTSGMLANAVTWESRKIGYDGTLKVAGAKDLAAIKELAVKAERVINASIDKQMTGKFFVTYGSRTNSKELGFWDNAKLVATYRSLCFSAVHAWAWSEVSAAQGLYLNMFAATAWVRASIAEARAQKRAAAK